MQFDYRFHERGTSVSRDDIVDGHIWLDVGNVLISGVIDHHSSGEYSCTVQALVNNPHLADDLKGLERVVINTHKAPDTDALFSICLLRYYLQNNSFPKSIDSIVEYVSQVDSGNIKISGDSITIYKMICVLGGNYNDSAVLDKCFMLIETAVRRSEEESDFSFMDTDILEGIDGFEAEKEKIIADYNQYIADKKEICEEKNVHLPRKKTNTASDKPAKALIWNEYRESLFNRLRARGEGFVLTVVPQKDKSYTLDKKTIECTDTIISIPPSAGDEYSLRYLAYILEQYEQDKEASILGEDNNKRDHSSPRGKDNKESRFFDKPWSATSDPWFFTNDHTLVQSPSTGSLMTTEEVIHIVKKFGECYVKKHSMNVLVPFTYDPSQYKNITKWLGTKGWIKEKKEKDIPWLDAEGSLYIGTPLQEYSNPAEKEKRHFQIFKNKAQKLFHQGNDCPLYDNNQAFNEDCYCVLFKYGAGMTIFTREVNLLNHRTLASEEVEKINALRNTLNAYLTKNKVYNRKDLRCLAPHFYTSVEVSSECLSMSNSLIVKYAKLICDTYENNGEYCGIEKLNYRTVLANTRSSTALIIATDERGESTNKNEYHYRALFTGAWFHMYLISLQQRYSLTEIKRSFTEHSRVHDNKAAKRLRNTLINFYATSYFTTATDDELGDRIYRGWHDTLKIDEIKTTVMEQINQHDEYNSNEVNAIFDSLSSWLIPLVALSTGIQIFINGKQLLDQVQHGDVGSLLGWAALLSPGVIIAMILVWGRNKK